MIKVSMDRKHMEAAFGRLEWLSRKDIDPVKRSARFLRKSIAERFDAEQDPWGVPWRPLSETTLRLRRARGNNSITILQDTRAMRRSLRVRDDTVEIRTPAEYHQEGGWGKMFGKGSRFLPQRKILPTEGGVINLPEAWKTQIVEFFAQWITRFRIK